MRNYTDLEDLGYCRKDFIEIEKNKQSTEQYWRNKIANDIKEIGFGEENNQLNALGMRMIAEKVARGVL